MKTAGGVLAACLMAASGAFGGQVSENHPDGIKCPMPASQDRPAGVSVFYISAVLNDGRVLYQSLGNQVLSVTFDPSGANLIDSGEICEGKSLSELKDAGMVFDF